MGGVVKTVTKPLNKAVAKLVKTKLKVLKKLAPIIAVGAALYFTAGMAGAALPGFVGAGATFGSLGGTLGTTLGLKGLAGSMVAGATKYAAWGAVAGGGMALVTGKDPWKGMVKGAAIGAVGGAVGGAISHVAAGAGAGAGAAAAPGAAAPGAAAPGAAAPGAAAPVDVTGGAANLPATTGTAAAKGTSILGKLKQAGAWAKENPMASAMLAQAGGSAIKGRGSGDLGRGGPQGCGGA